MAGPLPPGVPDGGHSAADPPPPGPTVRAADSSGVGAVKRPPSSDGDGTIVPANASGGRSSDGLKRLWNESRMCACRLAPGTSAVAVFAPATVRVAFDDFLHHLLHAAAAALVPGGRLVYWLPTVPDEYAPADVPVHPLLRLVANCEQPLSSKMSRRLITMERLPDEAAPPGGAAGATAATAAASGHAAVPVDPRAVPLPRRTHVPAHANLAAKVFGVADRLEDALPRRPVDGAAVHVKKGAARRRDGRGGAPPARPLAAAARATAVTATDVTAGTAAAVPALSTNR